MRQRLLCAYVLFAAGICAWSVGCSKGGPDEGPVVIVSGKLTNGAQPLEAKPDTTIELVFARHIEKGAEAPPDANTFRVHPDADGDYKLIGTLGHGIPPGEYEITVYQWQKAKPGEKITKEFVKGQRDLLKKFDAKTPPILRNITLSDKTVDVDISKP
jgi:hypothetical protein